MLISDSKRFIFIHIPRTAGFSVHQALQPWVDHQNLDFSKARWEKDYPHYTAREIREIAGKETLQEYFKFAFVRNPWDRMLSRYSYLKKFNDRPHEPLNPRGYYPPGTLSFLQWLKGGEPHGVHPLDLRPQKKWLVDDSGHIGVDFVGRFETLEADFETICQKIGLSLALPHVNRSDHGHYREYYDPEGRDIVAGIFREDIKTWSYQF